MPDSDDAPFPYSLVGYSTPIPSPASGSGRKMESKNRRRARTGGEAGGLRRRRLAGPLDVMLARCAWRPLPGEFILPREGMDHGRAVLPDRSATAAIELLPNLGVKPRVDDRRVISGSLLWFNHLPGRALEK
jgi:hypothetical protein